MRAFPSIVSLIGMLACASNAEQHAAAPPDSTKALQGISDTSAIVDSLSESGDSSIEYMTEVGDPFEPNISPDGKHFADFVAAGDSVYGFVRDTEAHRELFRTASSYVSGTDMLVGSARWHGNDSIYFYIQPDSLLPDRWLRYQSAVPHTGWRLDTISVANRK